MIADKPRAMVVAGVMSGTSADGVDVALVRVSPGVETPAVEVLGHRGFSYPGQVRAAVLQAMDAKATSVAELARLSWRLGQVYADCVAKACKELGVTAGGGQAHDSGVVAMKAQPRLELVGMHGQTLYHQAAGARFAGGMVRATWQIGEAAVLRERLGCPVLSDFRAADFAAGGQAAPLVPMLDFCMFREKDVGRVLLNLGGIANVTVLPAGCGLGDVVAFDTGPANMVIDALMVDGFAQPFDKGGRTARRGRVHAGVLAKALEHPFFAEKPPRSCGREQFGAAFVEQFGKLSRKAGLTLEDEIATAAELTVQSIVGAYRTFCARRLGRTKVEVIAAGGGVRNGFLMERLRAEFGKLGVEVRTMDEFGLEAQAKEAIAFALMAWLTWFGLDGNVASATGARGGRVLGKICW